MCGIAGWFCFDTERPEKEELIKLLINLSERGKHATGVAYKSTNFNIIKNGVEAKEFVNDPKFVNAIPELLKSKLVLLHTRNATHGNWNDNKNNHPIFNNNGLLIHNGVVFPDETYKADGQTDSEQLMLSIQKYGWSGLQKVTGSMSIAYINFKFHQLGVYLFTNGRMPLVWYFDGDRKILFFCSTGDILSRSIHMSKAFGLITKYGMSEVPTNKVFLVSQKGIELVYTLKQAKTPQVKWVTTIPSTNIVTHLPPVMDNKYHWVNPKFATQQLPLHADDCDLEGIGDEADKIIQGVYDKLDARE